MALLDSTAHLLRLASPGGFWTTAVLLGAAALALLYLAFRALRRSRMMEDLPTSKLRSAAQGYVELEGWARLMPGEPIIAPLSGLSCAWYRYRVERRDQSLDPNDRRSSDWHTVEKGVSEAIFLLEDGTGRCIVDPEGAEVTPSVRLCWRGQTERPGTAPLETGFIDRFLASGPYRYTEERIHERDHLYALGQFVGLGDAEAANFSEEVRDILATWKRDQPALLRRFDANGDGRIDLAEWEQARDAAEREAMQRRRDQPPPPEFNLLKRSPYGKPFVLSTVSQQRLILRNRRWFAVFLVGAVGLAGALAWAIAVRLA
ncbi:MAG: hypothetical protein FIA97_18655 [Methylococcaceae bacterium]|nr:hypothetical protein [Methylococcaceae bacterium]